MLQPNERIDQLYADDIKIIQSSEAAHIRVATFFIRCCVISKLR